MNKITPPFNLTKWIAENKEKMKPPVSNRNLYNESGDYIVMIVAGPNARKDYHYNETEELFYQIEGDITIGLQIDGKAEKVIVKEGEMFLLPAKIPHSPARPEGTIGLVIERKRTTDMNDGLQWYCENCNTNLKKYEFYLENIEKDFIPRFKEFYGSEEMRTCPKCGHKMDTDPKFT